MYINLLLNYSKIKIKRKKHTNVCYNCSDEQKHITKKFNLKSRKILLLFGFPSGVVPIYYIIYSLGYTCVQRTTTIAVFYFRFT